jgi:hypothetical protein
MESHIIEINDVEMNSLYVEIKSQNCIHSFFSSFFSKNTCSKVSQVCPQFNPQVNSITTSTIPNPQYWESIALAYSLEDKEKALKIKPLYCKLV